jgi:voltage-gated sodium channel
MATEPPPRNAFDRIALSAAFNRFITGVILLGAVLVGLETYPEIVARYGPSLYALNAVVLGIFIVEIAIRMAAEGSRPWRYFANGWNVFDFAIVAAVFVPGLSDYALAVRLLRLLRVLRLVRTVPDLQVIIGALLRALPSMGYVVVLLMLLFYVYAVAGTFLFRVNDPVHFGSLQLSLVSLFRVLTLEDWTDVMYTQMYGCADYGYGAFEELCIDPRAMPVVAVAYFVSFVLLGTMIFLNLFIGIIVNSMDEMRKVREIEKAPRETPVEEDLATLEQQLAEMQAVLVRAKAHAKLQAEKGA